MALQSVDEIFDDDKNKLQEIIPNLEFVNHDFKYMYNCVCKNCDQVAVNHRIANCGEMFCKPCFDDSFGKQCPVCERREINYYTQDKKILSRTMALKVFCPYKPNGCSTSEALQGLLKHLIICKYSPSKLLPKLYRGRPQDHTIDELEKELIRHQASIKAIEDQLKKFDHYNRGTDSILKKLRDDFDSHQKKIEPMLADINQVKKIVEANSKESQGKFTYLEWELEQLQTTEIEEQFVNVKGKHQAMCQNIQDKQSEITQHMHERILALNGKFQHEITDCFEEPRMIGSQNHEKRHLLSEVIDEGNDALQTSCAKLTRQRETQQNEFAKEFQLLAPSTESQNTAQQQGLLENISPKFQETTLKPQITTEINKLEEELEVTTRNHMKEIQYQATAEVSKILSRHEASLLPEMEIKLKSAVQKHVQNLSIEFQKTVNSLMNTLIGNQLQEMLNKIESTVKSQSRRPEDTLIKEWSSEAGTSMMESATNKHIKELEDELKTLSDKFRNFEEATQKTLKKEIEVQLTQESQHDVKQSCEQLIPKTDRHHTANQSFEQDKHQIADQYFEADNYQTTDHSFEEDMHLTAGQSFHQPKNAARYEMTIWKVSGINEKLTKSQQQTEVISSDELQFTRPFCCKLIANLEIKGKSDQILFSLKSTHNDSNDDECSWASLHVKEYRLLDQSEGSEKKDIIFVDHPHLRRNERSKLIGLIPIKVLTLDKNRYVKDDCIVIQINIKPLYLLYSNITSKDGILLWNIDNYKKRKQDEKDGIVKCLYSDSFYTSENGYRVHAKLYLDGNGKEAKGRYLSIFISFLAGEWDSDKSKTFQYSLSISIPKQKDYLKRGKDITYYSTVSDISKNCTATFDEKSELYEGFNKFCTQEQVECPSFIINDNLGIKIIVQSVNEFNKKKLQNPLDSK